MCIVCKKYSRHYKLFRLNRCLLDCQNLELNIRGFSHLKKGKIIPGEDPGPPHKNHLDTLPSYAPGEVNRSGEPASYVELCCAEDDRTAHSFLLPLQTRALLSVGIVKRQGPPVLREKLPMSISSRTEYISETSLHWLCQSAQNPSVWQRFCHQQFFCGNRCFPLPCFPRHLPLFAFACCSL